MSDMISFSSHFKVTVLLFFSPILPRERLRVLISSTGREWTRGSGWGLLCLLASLCSMSLQPGHLALPPALPPIFMTLHGQGWGAGATWGDTTLNPALKLQVIWVARGSPPASTHTGPVTSLRTDPHSLTVTFLISDTYSMRARRASRC